MAAIRDWRVIVASFFFLLYATYGFTATAKVQSAGLAAEPLQVVPAWLPQPFEEALIKTGLTSPAEDAALKAALDTYLGAGRPADLSPLEAFLANHPDTAWQLSLQTNLGLIYYANGYFSKAFDAWGAAWRIGKHLDYPQSKALADRAIGELIRMHARLGHVEQLQTLLADIEGRALTGPATEAVAGAKQGLWMMLNEPSVAYRCGPLALRSIASLSNDASSQHLKTLDGYPSSKQGVSLAQVAALAKKVELAYEPVFREGKAAIPVPSIVHWKVNHYAAIVAERDGYYHLQDPTFGADLWIPKEAVDAEGSGYFLIPKTELAAGWRIVSTKEASAIYGMGTTSSSNPRSTAPEDDKEKSCGANRGMCGYNIHSMLVSLNLTDTPVGYRPPIGPAVLTTLTYNQREAYQPAVPNFFNFGPKWTSNWLSYITDDPSIAGSRVQRYVAGGGARDYTNFNSTTGAFRAENKNASVLVRVSASPIRYERRMRDGSKEIYAGSDGATIYPRRIFLSQLMDRQGNALTFNYDSMRRLVSITDATGRNTTFGYGLASAPLLVTSITDPFGRSATMEYDGSGRLWKITDVLGLVSEFGYDAGSFVNSKTTPYGTTTFAFSESGTTRSLEITDPLGFKERVEYRHSAPGVPFSDPAAPTGMSLTNTYLDRRNTFYWDKHAYQLGAGDYTKARIKHWYHLLGNTAVTEGVLESTKSPLQVRTWFSTPGSSGYIGGTYDQPSRIGRVLDGGATQLTQISYNSAGNKTAEVDPLGRQTLYDYAANEIDVLRVRKEVSAGVIRTVAENTYNAQHMPLTYKDEAGQTTTYTYNAAGQVLTVTDALGRVTTYQYDSLGYLTRIIDADGQDEAIFTYDAAGRVATRADDAGNTLSYQYDNLDRLTRVTYPDTTYIQYVWNRLDLASETDRLGRATQYTYDANRNRTAVTDPANHTTQYEYFRNGELKSVTYADSGVAQWARDIESRVTGVTDPKGVQTTFSYNGVGLLAGENSHDSGNKQYAYNAAGDLAQQTDGRGIVSNYSYDSLRRLTGITYPGNTTENAVFSYDDITNGNVGLGRLTGYSNDGGSTARTYDAVGNIASEIHQVGSRSFTAGYAYDNLNRLQRITYPSGRIVDYARNTLGQITQVQLRASSTATPQTLVSGVTYRPLGPISALSFGNGVSTSIQHDAGYRVARITTSSNPARDFSYSYDAAGNVAGQTDHVDIYGMSYAYDAVDRLASQTNVIGTTTYGYDANGNRLQATLSDEENNSETQTFTYAAASNQLTAAYGFSVTHDAAGNLTSHRGDRGYTYNHANRLSTRTMVLGGQTHTMSTYLYNALGMRTRHSFVWDIDTVNAYDGKYLSAGHYNSQGLFRRSEYIWLDDLPVVQVSDDSSGPTPVADQITYIHADHLDTPRGATDEAGNLVWRWELDAFGAFMPQQTPDANGRLRKVDLRFPGQIDDLGDTIFYNVNRYYESLSGRYTQTDPLGLQDSLNPYIYVDGNPINFFDAEGLAKRGAGGKGERGYTGNSSGTNNPYKHMKPHPTDPNKVIQKDPQTGKKAVKPKPPGFPGSLRFPLLILPFNPAPLVEPMPLLPPGTPPEC